MLCSRFDLTNVHRQNVFTDAEEDGAATAVQLSLRLDRIMQRVRHERRV
jgi:hypothetical protein